MDATNQPRLTTAEAAVLLSCSQAEALILLKAAHVTFTRTTKFGAYLWCAADVHRLISALPNRQAVAK